MSIFSHTPNLLFKFLSRWALIAALVYLGLFIAFFMAFPTMQNSGLSDEYNELALAAHNPSLFKLTVGLSLLYWIMIGGFLIMCALLLYRPARIQSSLIMVSGVGQILGVIGALMSLSGVTNIAARYLTASSNQQTGLLQEYIHLRLSYTTYYEVSGALWAVALLMIAWAAWSAREFFPRWLAIIFGVGGLIGALNFASIIIARKYDAPVMAELSLLSIFFAVAVAFWRRASRVEFES